MISTTVNLTAKHVHDFYYGFYEGKKRREIFILFEVDNEKGDITEYP